MGLWERLHRDDDAGLAPAPSPTVDNAIDLAKAEAKSEARAEGRAEVWGRPGRCPACGERGYLDRVDIVDRVQYEHCPDCFHKWSVAERDTVKAV
jgi:hypothetical protein